MRAPVVSASSRIRVTSSAGGASAAGEQMRTSMPICVPPTSREQAMLKRASPR
jgi:hypothetical protein